MRPRIAGGAQETRLRLTDEHLNRQGECVFVDTLRVPQRASR